MFDALQANVWYLPTADGKAKLYVTEIGKGPTVIVLHGGPGNDFNYLIDVLRPHLDRYHFVLFDQRGSLLSPVAPADVATLTTANLVEDLESLRVALGESRAVLFGHSWGTFLAAAYYRAYPEHVAGLVLAATAPPQSREGASILDEVQEMGRRQIALQHRTEVAAARREAGVEGDLTLRSPRERRLGARIDNAAINLWHVERWRAEQGAGVYYNNTVSEAIFATFPTRYDTLATLTAHPVPVTILQGDHDYLDPSATGWAAIAPQAPTVQVHVLAGAGHYSWIDNPESFHRGLVDGLARATKDHGR